MRHFISEKVSEFSECVFVPGVVLERHFALDLAVVDDD